MIRKRLQATEQPAPAPHPESPGKPVFFSSFGRSSPSLGTCQPNEAVNVLHPPCPTINFPINARTPGIYQTTVLTLNIKPHLLIYISANRRQSSSQAKLERGQGKFFSKSKNTNIHPALRPALLRQYQSTSSTIKGGFFETTPYETQTASLSRRHARPGPTKEHEPLSKLTGNDQAKALAPIQNS